MDFHSNDPGAVRYGNFINYYQFNSAEERLKLLPETCWLTHSNIEKANQPYYVLDVGCNSGVFTQLLWKHLMRALPGRQVYILGVDIDTKLIERAIVSNVTPEFINFQSVDVMESESFNSIILEYLKTKDLKKFDAVCCFSITMWIHLNNHDEGLQKFLRRCSEVAELLVVEPQSWKCYQKAVRRMKKAGESFPYFLELKWRTQVEENIQKFIGIVLNRRKVYETSATKWKRKIYLYS